MSFYVCNSFNDQGYYSGREVHFFNSEVAKMDFSKEFYTKNGEDAKLHLCTSLKEIIVDIKFDNDLNNWQIQNKEIIDIYNDIIFKFGVDIHEKFPDEEFNNEFIKSIENECDKLGQDLMDYYHETEFDDKGRPKDEIYDHDDNNFDELNNNELRKWDEETGGLWRIENDFG